MDRFDNQLFLDSEEAEKNVRRGIRAPMGVDPNINVGSPSVPAPRRFGIGRTLTSNPDYKFVVDDQPNTERPTPVPIQTRSGGVIESNPDFKFVWDGPEPQQQVEPVARVEESGDTTRGFTTALQQTPALLKGAVGFAGAAGEKTFGEGGMFSSLKQWGLDGYQKSMAEIDKKAKDTDDVTVAWDKAKKGDLGALVDWVQYGIGYLGGNIVETGSTALLGAFAGSMTAGPLGTLAGGAVGAAGKEAVKGTAKNLIESMVAKEAAKLAEKTAAKEVSDEITKQAVRNVSKRIGSTTALAGSSIIKETGSIYGEAEEEAAKEGRKLDGGDLARIFGAGVVAGISEAAIDRLGLDVAAGRLRIPGSGRAGRVLVGSAAGVGIEGGQELFQTAVERFGAAKSLTNEEAVKEYINAFALGGLGGGIVGGVSGAVRGGEPSSSGGDGRTTDSSGTLGTGGVTPPGGSGTSTGIDGQAIDDITRDEQVKGTRILRPDEIRRTVSEGNGLSFIAAIYNNSTPEDQVFLRRTIERTGNLAAFEEALQNEEMVNKGQSLIAAHPEFTERFIESARVFAATKPTTSRVKAMPIIQQQGETNETTTTASTPPGQPGGPVGSNQVLGQTGAGQAQGTGSQATGSTGAVDQNTQQPAAPVDNLRFSKAAAPADPRTQEVSDRLQKLFLDQDIPIATQLEAENALSQGRLDKVERFIDTVYEKLNKAPKADINGARRLRNNLKTYAGQLGLTLNQAEESRLDELLQDGATRNNIDTAKEILQNRASNFIRSVAKKNPKAADDIFKISGLQDRSVFADRTTAAATDPFATSIVDDINEEETEDKEETSDIAVGGSKKEKVLRQLRKRLDVLTREANNLRLLGQGVSIDGNEASIAEKDKAEARSRLKEIIGESNKVLEMVRKANREPVSSKWFDENFDFQSPNTTIERVKPVVSGGFSFDRRYNSALAENKNFQRIIDLIVAMVARGEVDISTPVKEIARRSPQIREFLGFPRKPLTDDQVIAKIMERNQARADGNFELSEKIESDLLAKNVQLQDTTEGTKFKRIRKDDVVSDTEYETLFGTNEVNPETGWLGKTKQKNIESVLAKQQAEGRDFGVARKEAWKNLSQAEKDIVLKRRSFQAEVRRIINLVNEGSSYRRVLANLRAEQDRLYAALNGFSSRNIEVRFKDGKPEVFILQTVKPNAEAGAIASQLEGPKSGDTGELTINDAGMVVGGPMQSAAPERLVDLKGGYERSAEAIRKRAAEISEMIRGIQEKSVREQAKFFRENLLQLRARLAEAKALAEKNGLPEGESLPIYNEALQSIKAFEVSERVDDQVETAINEAANSTQSTLTKNPITVAQADLVQSMWQAAVKEMRDGKVTLTDVINWIRSQGRTVPQEFLAVASEEAVRTPLSRYMDQHNGGYLYRNMWAASLFRAANKAKKLGLTDDLVADLPLTDSEKAAYFSWLKHRSKRASRTVVNEAATPQEAFADFLFAKYSLEQMRDPSLISNEKDRALVQTLFESTAAAVEAWYFDVYEAQKLSPGMFNLAMVGRVDFPGRASVALEPMISQENLRTYKAWRSDLLTKKIEQAKRNSERKYREQLASIEGLSDEDYQKYRLEIAVGDINRSEAALRKALQRAAMEGDNARALDELSASFVEQGIPDEMAMATSLDELANAIRRKTVEDLANEQVRTRKDFYGQELSGEGESGIVFNEDGDYDYDADDLRAAKTRNNTGVLTQSIVEDEVRRLTSGWALAPQIKVYANADALPEPLRTQVIEKLGPDWNAKGLYNGEDGSLYLFSDHMGSLSDVQFTLFHEADGHLGMRAFLGSKLNTFLNTAYRTNPKVRAAADQKVREEGLPLLEAVEESLADIAGTGATVPQFKALVGRFIAALRDAGFDKVADWLSSLTDAEVAFVLKSARDTARNGGQKLIDGAPGEIRLSDERMPYEMFSYKNGKVTSYARYNPITNEWLVFTAVGEDIRNDYVSQSMPTFEQTRELMNKYGKLERRLRSGEYIDDKIATDLANWADARPKFDGKWGKFWKLVHSATLEAQNEHLPWFRLVEHLRQKGQINDFNDVQKALTLYERITGVELEDFTKKYVTPLMDLVEKASKKGATKDDINKYLIAMHAEERNLRVFKINPKNPFGSGMQPNDQVMPDGTVKEGYNTILGRVRNSPYAQELAQMSDLLAKMSDEKVKYMARMGLITTRDALSRMVYKNYVNLSGIDPALDETPDVGDPIGQKFNLKGAERRALGRSDLAPDVLARTLQSYEAALIRGQKNKVARTVLSLIETNYDPNEVVVNEQSFSRKLTQDGFVEYVLDPNYIMRPDVMVAKVNGIPTTIRFKNTGKGTLADSIHGVVLPQDQDGFLEAVGKVTQFIGRLVTTYNPAWILVNFTRDVQTLYFNAAADKKITKQMADEMIANLYDSVKLAIYVAAEGSPKIQSRIKPRADLLQSYQEMRKEGGLTHFINRKGLEEQIRQVEIALTGKKNPMEKIQSMLGFMELITLPMEMAPRLAAYHVAKKHGFSKSDAAVLSGDITVNFNMRGRNKAIRNLYLFFNPAIQGANKLWRLYKDDPKTFAKIAGGWFAVGLIAGFLGRMLNDDDESGKNELDKVPVYKRATSIVLFTDVPFGAIPIAWGYNAFYAAGTFLSDTLMGVQPASVTAKRIAKSAFEAFSPIGGAGLDSKTIEGMLGKAVTPTVALPYVEWIMNENRFGAPIYKEQSAFGGAQTPDAYMSFDSASPISKGVARALNSLTGGNKFSPGSVDFNPAAMDFVINAFLPGLVAETYKLASVGVQAAIGEDIKKQALPIIGRFEARVPENYDAGAFKRAEELVMTKWREFEKSQDPKVMDEIRREYPGLGQAKAIISSHKQAIRQLESTLEEIENNKNISDERKTEMKNQYAKMKRTYYNRAVKAAMDVGTEDNKPFRNVLIASD